MENKKTDNISNKYTTRLRQIFIIVFAAIAFFMTSYATSGGARMFLTESYAWIGITALAVGFLAFTSLILGDGITSNRVSQIGVVTPFYLIAVAICWICSFASYHQQFLSVGKSDLANAETNLRQMGIYAHDITRDLKDQFDDRKARLLNGEVFNEYSARLITLSDEMRDRDRKKEISAQLERLIEARKLELANRQAKVKATENSLRRDIDQLAVDTEILENRSTVALATVASTEALARQVELALKEEEGDPNVAFANKPFLQRDTVARQVVDSPACDRRRRAGTGGGTPGTCYFALSEKLTETRVVLDESTKASRIILAELESARQNLAGKQEDLQDLLAQSEADAQQMSDGLTSGFDLDADEFMRSVNAFIDQPSQSSFSDTAGYCDVVTEVLSDLKVISDLPPCEPQALTAVFQQIKSLDSEQNSVVLACNEADGREQIIVDLRHEMAEVAGPGRLSPISRAYDRMRNEVLETCLVAAEQRGLNAGPFREDLTNLYDRINPSQDPISQAIGKVKALFDGSASARDYFPALLALLQELSLLLSKLFWDANTLNRKSVRKEDADISDLDLEARPEDPLGILAAKNVVLNSTYHRQGYLLPHIFDEEYSHEMRSHMRRIIDNLFRKKLASKSSRGIMISDSGMAEVAGQIRRHNQTVASQHKEPVPSADVAEQEPVKEGGNSPVVSPVTVVEDPDKSGSADKTAVAQNEIGMESADEPEPAIEAPMHRPRKRRPVIVRPNFRREV